MKSDQHYNFTLVNPESHELFGRADDEANINLINNSGAKRSPLRGIKEHENEDASELTPYRPSNVYLTTEPAFDKTQTKVGLISHARGTKAQPVD